AGNAGSFKGDVARSVFYMAVRYNGLDVVSGNPPNNTVGQFGNLDSLLVWHRNDPPDDFEMNRNNVVYTWQKNRNPFIDYPDLVEYIWGNQQGNTWNQPMKIEENNLSSMWLYPNPSSGKINISGIEGKAWFVLYNLPGEKIFTRNIKQKASFNIDLPTGIYLVTIVGDKTTQTSKLIIR